MESRIKSLLEKYWEGETTLVEEKEIKSYFKENPSLTNDGQYFRSIDVAGQSTYKGSTPGKRKLPSIQWMSVAATITIGLMVAFIALNDSRKEDPFAVTDPKEAYEVTRNALMMISSNLNESNEYSKELKKINKAEELINQ